MNSEPAQQDLLTDETNPFFEYTPATVWQRLLNFVIDNIFIRLALTYVTGVFLGMVLALMSPGFLQNLYEDSGSLYLLGLLVTILDYLVYYSLCEFIFKGTTLGKLITGTRAVKENGEELGMKDAFLRSACRLIPFEPLSGFGKPWHDGLTHTLVVQSRR